jgi:hypothetical protein
MLMKIAPLTMLALACVVSCTHSPGQSSKSRSEEYARQSAAAFAARNYAEAQSLAERATRLSPEFAEAWVG